MTRSLVETRLALAWPLRARWLPVVLALQLAWPLADAVAGQQLLDRVVARVNGQPLTLTDLNAAIALGIADGTGRAAVEQLVDRMLVLAEVARFPPPEPMAAEVDGAAAALAARAGDRLPAVMAATGLDEGRIREMARENLRVQAYVDQRFGSAAQLSEEDVLQYYRIRPEEFTRDGRLMPFAEAQSLARERAAAGRRETMLAQWRLELRGRAEIVVSGD